MADNDNMEPMLRNALDSVNMARRWADWHRRAVLRRDDGARDFVYDGRIRALQAIQVGTARMITPDRLAEHAFPA